MYSLQFISLFFILFCFGETSCFQLLQSPLSFQFQNCKSLQPNKFIIKKNLAIKNHHTRLLARQSLISITKFSKLYYFRNILISAGVLLIGCKNVLANSIPNLLKKDSASFGKINLNIKGWDLYGRVPFDDFLFQTSNLIDPYLLKRSFVEAVSKVDDHIHFNFIFRLLPKSLMPFQIFISINELVSHLVC